VSHDLQASLAERRQGGRKLVVPYVTAGAVPHWLQAVLAVAGAGADAVEIGLPFSDPMMDGPTIQEASVAALQRGTTVHSVLDVLQGADVGVPLVVMTYYNLIFRMGEERFAGMLASAGVAGAIVPDLPLEESGSWRKAADAAGIDTVLLVAPSTPDKRAEWICEASSGFVYAVGRMGVTGEQADLAASARQVAHRLRSMTSLPVCVGIGISTAAQAVDVCQDADGVIIGSALVRRLLDGVDPLQAAAFIGEVRGALDATTT